MLLKDDKSPLQKHHHIRSRRMTTLQTDISAIIVTWNSSQWISNCLKSLMNDLRSFCYKIVVVDNASTDETPDLIRENFPEVILVRNTVNEGFAQACNRAILECQAEYVLFINPDTEVIPGMTNTLITFMKGHPEAGAIGPTLLNTDGSLQLSGNTFPNLRNIWAESLFLDRLFPGNRFFGSHKLSHLNRSEVCKVDWTMGSCLLLRKEALDKAGSFDNRFFLFFEETDLCLRLKKAGYEVYIIPEARIVHGGGSSRLENYNANKIIHYHRSLFHYFNKNLPAQLLWVRAAIFIRSVIRIFMWLSLYPCRTQTAKEKFRGYCEAIKLCLFFK